MIAIHIKMIDITNLEVTGKKATTKAISKEIRDECQKTTISNLSDTDLVMNFDMYQLTYRIITKADNYQMIDTGKKVDICQLIDIGKTYR